LFDETVFSKDKGGAQRAKERQVSSQVPVSLCTCACLSRGLRRSSFRSAARFRRGRHFTLASNLSQRSLFTSARPSITHRSVCRADVNGSFTTEISRRLFCKTLNYKRWMQRQVTRPSRRRRRRIKCRLHFRHLRQRLSQPTRRRLTERTCQREHPLRHQHPRT
jgi:hypothetical protein